MILKSPLHESDLVNNEMELVGPHVTSDPSVEGIDEFGTNTFQIYIWMANPAVPCDSSSDLNACTDQQPANQSAQPPMPLRLRVRPHLQICKHSPMATTAWRWTPSLKSCRR